MMLLLAGCALIMCGLSLAAARPRQNLSLSLAVQE